MRKIKIYSWVTVENKNPYSTHQEVSASGSIEFANTTEKESDDGILVTDDRDQFATCR